MLPVKKTMTETTVITLKNNLSLIYFWSDFFSDSRHLNLLLHLTLRTGKALEAGKHTNPSLHRVLGTPRFVILNPPKMWDLWIGSLPELERELWCVDGNEAAASGEDEKLFEEAQIDLPSPAMVSLCWRCLGPAIWYWVSAQHREPGSRYLMNPWGQRMRKYLHRRLL